MKSLQASIGDSMELFKTDGNNTHLEFRLPPHTSAGEETKLVMEYLAAKGVEIGKAELMPYCDIYKCKLGDLSFDLCADLNYGCSISADKNTISELEVLLSGSERK